MKRCIALLVVAVLLLATPLFAGSVATMDKEELKGLLGSDTLVILDVRAGRDWSTSEFKIEGAERMVGKDLSVAEKYPKDSTFVLYCA